MKGGFCWSCATPLNALEFGRQDICRKCGRDTRTCKACTHFDPACNNQCREPQADRVVEKERSNFCDYFLPSEQAPGSATTSRDALKSAAEALFKKKS